MLRKNKKIIIVALIAAAAVFSGVYFGIISNTAAAKLARQFNAAPEIKSKYQLYQTSLVLPARDQNSVEIILGEKDAKEFIPNLEITKWDGEVSMKIKPQIAQAAEQEKTLEFENEKINFKTQKEDYRFYNIAPNREHPEGAYEFEVILKEKPQSNVVSLDIETENLDFFYQPPLNQEQHRPNVVSCTETQCFNKDGKAIVNRPENVVGSYAVFRLGQMGKVFHIYRPQILDAGDNKVWGELNIDTPNNKMTVTVPQDFLDKAAYPVTVDPTFGYDSTGGSDLDLQGNIWWNQTTSWGAYSFTCPGSGAQNITDILAYLRSGDGQPNSYRLGVYTTGGTLVVAGNAAKTVSAESYAWIGYTTDITWYNGYTALTGGTTYRIAVTGVYNAYIAIDSGSAGDDSVGYGDYTAGLPDPLPGIDFNSNDRLFFKVDVSSAASCGDGNCDSGETHGSCPTDCRATIINKPLTNFMNDDSLVGYWSFDGAATNWTSATEGTTNDLSGNNNTGTLTNMSRSSSPKPGISGQGLSFNGSDDYVDMGIISSLTGGLTRVTVSAWVKARNSGEVSGEVHFVDTSYCQGGPNGGIFELLAGFSGANKAEFTIYKAGGTPDIYNSGASLTSIDDTKWHFITGVYDGANVMIYVDGVWENQTPASGITMPALSYPTDIGGYCSGISPYYFSSLIDEVRVYDRALAPSEIMDLYRAGAAKMQVNTPTTYSLTDGLVGNWTFNGQDISGTTAYDRSGSSPANNGTLTNGPKPVIGKVGQALNFDGSDDVVSIPDTNSIDVTGSQITVAVWIYPDTVSGRNTFFVYKYAGGGGYMLYLSAIGSAGLLVYTGQGGSNYVAVETLGPLSPSTWTFLVATYDSSGQIKVYVNGNFNNSAAPNGDILSSAGGDLYFGREGWQAENNYKFDGLMDEVRIYNRALSASEIQQLYNLSTRTLKFKQ